MRVKCRETKLDRTHEAKRQHDSSGPRARLIVGQTYTVYAFSKYRDQAKFLVLDESRAPNWWPCSLFEVPSAALPADWHFAYRNSAEEEGAEELILGYQEIVENPEHLSALMARDERALRDFWKMKYQREYAHRWTPW